MLPAPFLVRALVPPMLVLMTVGVVALVPAKVTVRVELTATRDQR